MYRIFCILVISKKQQMIYNSVLLEKVTFYYNYWKEYLASWSSLSHTNILWPYFDGRMINTDEGPLIVISSPTEICNWSTINEHYLRWRFLDEGHIKEFSNDVAILTIVCISQLLEGIIQCLMDNCRNKYHAIQQGRSQKYNISLNYILYKIIYKWDYKYLRPC